MINHMGYEQQYIPKRLEIFHQKVSILIEDNLSDFYGNKSTLCEDIAREIFKDIEGVFFCTSNE